MMRWVSVKVCARNKQVKTIWQATGVNVRRVITFPTYWHNNSRKFCHFLLSPTKPRFHKTFLEISCELKLLKGILRWYIFPSIRPSFCLLLRVCLVALPELMAINYEQNCISTTYTLFITGFYSDVTIFFLLIFNGCY